MPRLARFTHALLLVLAGILLVATPVFGFLYRAPVAVTENVSTAYTMLPVLWDQNNTWLASNGFMSSTANDTRVQSLGGLNKPWMVADNKTLTAISIPADSQTNLYFATGETASSSMDIITGYGGYITTADHADLELTDNFTINLPEAYVDTSTAPSVLTTSNVTNTTLTCYDATWRGQSFVASASTSVITSVRLRFYRKNNPSGNIGVYLRRYTGATLSATDIASTTTAIDASTITVDVAGAWYSFAFDNVPLSAGCTYAVVVGGITGDAGNYIHWLSSNAAPYGSGTAWTSGDSGATWSAVANQDAEFEVNGYTGSVFRKANAVDLVAGNGNLTAVIWSADTNPIPTYADKACSTGEHDIIVSADTVNLSLSVDGVAQTTALAGASVPGNANDYIWGSNIAPYFGQIQLYQGANYRINYDPNAIVLTTALPNRQVPGSYTGLITWGSNPAGVGVTLGSMTSSGQPSIGATTDTSTSDLLPVTGGTDWRPDAGVSAKLQANPLRPIVVAISDNTSLSEYQVWVWFGIIFVVFITALVGANVRGHHTLTGIATSAAIILLVVWDIFPLLSLLAVVLVIWGGHVSERSPSL